MRSRRSASPSSWTISARAVELSYLWKFPFDKIKIDRSFMEGFAESGRDVETVIKTIIALGRELNMRVTVEGVENATQVDFLYDADADQVQGFYFGYPVPATELAAEVMKNLSKTVTPETGKPDTKARPKAACKCRKERTERKIQRARH